VTVELRGAGPASRQVNAICMPETFPAQRLLVCEVLTPAGNWSSYPPHKHDDEQAGESVLEEIYYFHLRREAGVPGEGGVGFQRVYGPGIDVLAEVRDGDVVLVPHGWHGPSMAVPGYDMYYLNVMAGPSPQRSWTISLDPDHAWIRDGWAGQRVDPRLPMTGGSQP
jgi:5-deoxy-glucuronate isomerase